MPLYTKWQQIGHSSVCYTCVVPRRKTGHTVHVTHQLHSNLRCSSNSHSNTVCTRNLNLYTYCYYCCRCFYSSTKVPQSSRSEQAHDSKLTWMLLGHKVLEAKCSSSSCCHQIEVLKLKLYCYNCNTSNTQREYPISANLSNHIYSTISASEVKYAVTRTETSPNPPELQISSIGM